MQLQPLFKQSKICMSVSSNTLFFVSFFVWATNARVEKKSGAF